MISREHLFRTKVEVPKWDIPIQVTDHVVFLGSCFAQYIGERFQSFGLHSICNPLGVLYNPESIRLQVHAALHLGEEEFPVFKAEREWRSWWAGTLISGKSEQECRNVMEGALQMLRLSLFSADYLFLTLGTSVCYRLQASGAVVALSALIEDLFLENPNLKIVFTISPYRYAKYGFHGNQVAKSTLMLAVEEILKKYPKQVSYFPAYEIVLDELRDYRFYSEDMLHPSGVAIDYIWQCLVQSAMSPLMQDYLQEYAPVRSGLFHTPSNPESDAYKRFLTSLEEKAKQIRAKYNIE